MQNIRQAMNNGAFDFATKPIDMDDLAVTIGKAIEQIHFVHESQKEHTQLESLKKDLTTARDIQQYILPQVFPPFPEDTGLLDIYASMVAAKDIGGDFYDFFRIDADRIALVIADVCGKGIPAALFMAVSRTIIRSKGTQCDNAAECITETNRLLAAYSVDCMFVTAFYAIYNIKTGQLNYCNAGHNPPYLIKADGKTEELPMPTDVIVGAFDEIKYEECTMQMDHGDTLVMFTDGVPEAMNPDLEEFGTDRLCNILSGMADKCCKEIIETIKASIDNFAAGAEQSDDITMLVLKRK